MGTNYYWASESRCPTCGRLDHDPLHIGKSSGGWCFSLHVRRPEDAEWDQTPADLKGWQELWASGGEITDENGETLTVAQMLDWITKRGSNADGICNTDRYWEGTFSPYRSAEEFHRLNHSQVWPLGPNNLLRHQLDGRHCIGHGEGPWDLIIGDFS